MIGLDLCDTIEFRVAASPGVRLCVSSHPPWSGSWPAHASRLAVSTDGNLVERGYRETCARLGLKPACDIDLRKSIPVQAGLGGGSADAAAGIVAAFALAGHDYDASLAADVAAGVGSDVNFFLEGWTSGGWAASCVGRGEVVSPLAVRGGVDWLLVFPAIGCETAAVFCSLSLPVGKSNSLIGPASCEAAIEAVASGKVEAIRRVMFNGLAAAARRSNGELDEVFRAVERAAGESGVTLSGSGSTIALPCLPSESGMLAFRLSRAVQCPVRVARLWETDSLTEQLDGVRGL